MTKTRIALVGIGKIARDQHIPALAASSDFELAAAVTSHDPPEGMPGFRTISDMAAAIPAIQAISICTPPRGRLALITEAFTRGLDVMIEKPPAATVSEALAFSGLAQKAGRVLYATWHSREAAAVEPARNWLIGKRIRRVQVNWKEDVRVWHPGQEWIWEPGIGVFDPGINALSILTAILPHPLELLKAELRFPANRAAPISASLAFTDSTGVPAAVEFDFDQRGPQSWDIEVETDGGKMSLFSGASQLAINEAPVEVQGVPEYPGLYRRFASLLACRTSDIDLRPFHHVADAFLIGRRTVVAPFHWDG